MFGKQSDPSRTEEATPKRKRKQRQEGNVPKSQELGKVVSIVGGLIILNLWIGPMSDKIKLIFRSELPGPAPAGGQALDLQGLQVQI